MDRGGRPGGGGPEQAVTALRSCFVLHGPGEHQQVPGDERGPGDRGGPAGRGEETPEGGGAEAQVREGPDGPPIERLRRPTGARRVEEFDPVEVLLLRIAVR